MTEELFNWEYAPGKTEPAIRLRLTAEETRAWHSDDSAVWVPTRKAARDRVGTVALAFGVFVELVDVDGTGLWSTLGPYLVGKQQKRESIMAALDELEHAAAHRGEEGRKAARAYVEAFVFGGDVEAARRTMAEVHGREDDEMVRAYEDEKGPAPAFDWEDRSCNGHSHQREDLARGT